MYLVYRIIEINYIGITKNLKLRKNDHKHRLTNEKNKYHNLKLYQTIRNNNYNFNEFNI